MNKRMYLSGLFTILAYYSTTLYVNNTFAYGVLCFCTGYMFCTFLVDLSDYTKERKNVSDASR